MNVRRDSQAPPADVVAAFEVRLNADPLLARAVHVAPIQTVRSMRGLDEHQRNTLLRQNLRDLAAIVLAKWRVSHSLQTLPLVPLHGKK